MFNDLPGTRRAGHPGKSAAMGVAAGAHGVAVLMLLAASVLTIEAIDPPRLPLIFSMPLRLELPSAPPAVPRKGPTTPRHSTPRTQLAVVQPTTVATEPAKTNDAEPGLVANQATLTDVTTTGGVPGGTGTTPGGTLPMVSNDALPPPQPPPVPIPAHSPGVTPPTITYRVEPVYPEVAKAARVQGLVVIEAVVNSMGQVVDLRVLRGHPILARAASDAVSQWRFTPGLLRGKPADVILTVTVAFKLT